MRDGNLYALTGPNDLSATRACYQLVSSDAYEAHRQPTGFKWVYELHVPGLEEQLQVNLERYRNDSVSLSSMRAALKAGQEPWARYLNDSLEEEINLDNDSQLDAFLRNFEDPDDWEYFEIKRLQEFIDVLEPRMPGWASVEWAPVSMGSTVPMLCLEAPHTLAEFVQHVNGTLE